MAIAWASIVKICDYIFLRDFFKLFLEDNTKNIEKVGEYPIRLTISEFYSESILGKKFSP